jgi:hypothetical protein
VETVVAKKVGRRPRCEAPGRRVGYRVESGGEVVVPVQCMDNAGLRHGRGRGTESSVVEKIGEFPQRKDAVGGSEAGAVNFLDTVACPPRGGGTTVRGGKQPPASIGHAIRRCVPPTSPRCDLARHPVLVHSSQTDKDDSLAKASALARHHNPSLPRHALAPTFARPRTHGRDNLGELPVLPGLLEAQAGRRCLDVLHPKDSLEHHGSESQEAGGAPTRDDAPYLRTVAMVSRCPTSGRKPRSIAVDSMARHVRPPLPSCVAEYDPGDVVSKVLSYYSPEVQTPLLDGVLDHIDPELVGRLLLPEITSKHSPVGIAIRLISDPAALGTFIASTASPVFIASHRAHSIHVHDLLATGLASVRVRKDKESGFAKFFTVEKKRLDDGTPVLRTILDCRSANECFADPLPVNLPTLPNLLEVFSHVEEMRALDLRHWYHQIPIHKLLRQWFNVSIGPVRCTWNVLPMGWKWACFVAQAITTYAVAGDVALTWEDLPPLIRTGNVTFAVVYDNVIVGGPAHEVEIAWAAVKQRLSSLNAVIKEEFIACGGTSLSALGLEWCPSVQGLQWRLVDKFCGKACNLASALTGCVSAKTIAAALGTIAWSRYAARRDLFDMQPFYRTLSIAVAERGWLGQLQTSTFVGLRELLYAIPALGWQSAANVRKEILVFSDAHVTGYGAVGGDPISAFGGVWSRRFESADMFYLEAIAAKKAVSTFCQPNSHVFLALDNRAVMFALKKGSTACPRTAPVLAAVAAHIREYSASLTTGWIPTDYNPADPLSRGLPLRSDLVQGAECHVIWTRPPVSRWGSEWGRVVG